MGFNFFQFAPYANAAVEGLIRQRAQQRALQNQALLQGSEINRNDAMARLAGQRGNALGWKMVLGPNNEYTWVAAPGTDDGMGGTQSAPGPLISGTPSFQGPTTSDLANSLRGAPSGDNPSATSASAPPGPNDASSPIDHVPPPAGGSGPLPPPTGTPSPAPTPGPTTPTPAPTVSPPAAPPTPRAPRVVATGVTGAPRRVDPNAPSVIAQKNANAIRLQQMKDSVAAATGPNSQAAIVADSTKSANNAKNQNAFGYHPPVTPTITVLPGANGGPAQGVVTHGPGTGSTMPLPSVDKAAAGGGGGSLSPDQRNAMLNQAEIDNETMKAYENQILDGTRPPVGTITGAAGAAAGAHGSTGAQIVGILGNAAVGGLDPDYQKYLTAQASYGRIMGNLQSKRYTDNQAQIEKSISGLQGNDLSGTIRYKQQLRDQSLGDVGGPPAGLNLSPIQQKYQAAVAHLQAQGKTQAQIDAAIGPPPGAK